MIGNEIIVLVLLITGCFSADDNSKAITLNVTTDATSNKTIASTTILPVTITSTITAAKKTTTSTKTTTESFPLLEDLISADRSALNDGKHDDHFDDEKNTAKRTISSKFTGPIIVNENTNLFTPSHEFSKKQRINVQIIEPESHNNGQFLQETVFLRQENNTVVTSTTTSTTERPGRRKNIVAEQKFLVPIHTSTRLPLDRQRPLTTDEDCDDVTERANIVVTERPRKVLENVNIQQNTKIQKVVYKEEPKQNTNLVFGARVFSTTRPPCDQSLPCSTVRAYKPSPTPRLQPIHSTPLVAPRVFTTPRIVNTTPRIVVSTPPPVVVTPIAPVATVTPVPVRPIRPVPTVIPVTEKPVYIHTHSEVPVVHKEFVHLPPKIIEKPVIHKEFVQLPPQVQIVEKPKIIIQKEFVHSPPQEKIVPVEVEKLVVKEVPINNIIEKHIEHPPAVVEKLVPYPVASKPIEVERIVEVPVDRVVEKTVPVNHVVEKPVAVPVVQYVDRPIHIPYILPVEIPVAYHVPYLVKPPPPPQKQHFIIKTTKYGKGHSLFDWKHNLHKHVKHVFVKKPNQILADDIIAPPTIDSIGLLPPPRYQPYSYSENFGPTAAASINVAHAVLPNTLHNNREPFFEPLPIHNGFGNYDNKLKYVDSFSKDIRWEFGFKPPLVPSVAIDEFGNPLHEH